MAVAVWPLHHFYGTCSFYFQWSYFKAFCGPWFKYFVNPTNVIVLGREISSSMIIRGLKEWRLATRERKASIPAPLWGDHQRAPVKMTRRVHHVATLYSRSSVTTTPHGNMRGIYGGLEMLWTVNDATVHTCILYRIFSIPCILIQCP